MIYLDFGRDINHSKLSTALSNWSIISREKFLFQLDFNKSTLEDCVLDLYQDSSRTLHLIWCPGSVQEQDVALGIRFNAESSRLARFLDVTEMELKLVVETCQLEDGVVVEKSECVVSGWVGSGFLDSDPWDPWILVLGILGHWIVV